MACVTLKRPLDFDPLEALHSPNRPPTKRRRCTPIKKMERDGIDLALRSSAATSSSTVFRENPLSTEEIANNLRDELKRMKRRKQLVPYEEPSTTSLSTSLSKSLASLQNARRPPLSTSPIHSAPSSPEPMADQTSSHASTSAVPPTTKGLLGTREKPVFTLKQMTLICERMCKEREEKVRQEYDKILQQKLSEQYDAFVKFIDHQIQQRFNQSQLPSYLS